MSLENHLQTPLAKAVRLAGSQSEFGRLIGRTQSTVSYWLQEGKELPAEHVLQVETKLGLSRHELRPDIYPLEHSSAPVANECDEQHLRPTGVPVAGNRQDVLQ